MTDPNVATFSTAVSREIGIDDYSYLLSLLPDAFFDAGQEVRDQLWRRIFLAIAQGETLEAVADQVEKAMTLAAEIAQAVAQNVKSKQPTTKGDQNEPTNHA